MRIPPGLVVVVGLLPGCNTAPTAPPLDLTGLYEGEHQQTGGVTVGSVIHLQQSALTVTGVQTWFGPGNHWGKIQGTIQETPDTTVTLTIVYQDSCGGTATGTLKMSAQQMYTYDNIMQGTVIGEDQCRGSYTSTWWLGRLHRPD